MIGVFRSSLFRLADDVPSGVRFVVERLLCFLIVGIHASGISIPLSLLFTCITKILAADGLRSHVTITLRDKSRYDLILKINETA